MAEQDSAVRDSLKKITGLAANEILRGTMISIDPSAGSPQCMPAWAVFKNGQLEASSRIVVPKELLKGVNYTPHRLKYIVAEFQRLFPLEFDIMAVEGSRSKTNAGTAMPAFQQLNQAIGATVGCLKWKKMIYIYPWEWQEMSSGIYDKQDAVDAIQVGLCAIKLARANEAKE